MRDIDGPTFLLLLAAGLSLGLHGYFDFDVVAWGSGEQYRPLAYIATGVAAVWQFFRQPWRGSI